MISSLLPSTTALRAGGKAGRFQEASRYVAAPPAANTAGSHLLFMTSVVRAYHILLVGHASLGDGHAGDGEYAFPTEELSLVPASHVSSTQASAHDAGKRRRLRSRPNRRDAGGGRSAQPR